MKRVLAAPVAAVRQALAAPAVRRLPAALAAVLILAGCGGSADTDAATGPDAPAGLSGTVTVFAAASLTGSFGTLGRQFETAHPGVTVRFNFAASSALAASIGQGAPADVFASASPKNMDTAVTGTDAAPRTFATNTMAVAVPPDDPAGVTTLADLAKPGLKLALCEEQVPCGAAARTVLDRAGLAVTPVTYGADVKAVLTAVQLGEVDAGIVYRTDVRAAGDEVRGVEIPAGQNATTAYPIVTLADAPNRTAADAFVAYVLSEAGRAVLTEAGFTAP